MINSIMTANYTQAVNFKQPQSRPSPSIAAEDKKGADTVNISNEAKYLSQFPNINSVRDIEESLANATSYVEKRLQSLYSKHGIPSNSEMKISVGRDGSIIVNRESAASESLAEEINADDELSNSILTMSANTSLLEGIKKHDEFAAVYAKDPKAAVERYGYLFEDDHDSHVSFSVQNGHEDRTFEKSSGRNFISRTISRQYPCPWGPWACL